MIAIASDTYDRISSENREIESLQKKVYFLADYVGDTKFSRIARRGKLKKKFIFTLTPKIADREKGHEWEGKVSTFRKTVKKAMQLQQENFNKSISGV